MPTNYLIDTDHGVIVDVEATRAIRQAEVGASRTMLERTEERFGLKPGLSRRRHRLWVSEKPRLAWSSRSRSRRTFPSSTIHSHGRHILARGLSFDPEANRYTCPAGKHLLQFRRNFAEPGTGVTAAGTRLYRGTIKQCGACDLKPRCCPNMVARKIPRDVDEDAREVARAQVGTPEYEAACRKRKKVEMLFAHLKRILRLNRLRLRGPCGAKDEFLLAATAQNLRRLAKLRPMGGQLQPVAA